MRQRTRKLLGTIVLMIFVPIYALVVMTIGSIRLADASTLERTLFFFVGGLVWLIPAGAVIWWMQRPEPPAR